MSHGEYFHYINWRFDVDQARRLIAATPRETVNVDPTQVASAFGLYPPREERDGIIVAGLIDVDRVYAMAVDLSEPLILATIVDTSGRNFHLLIDGWHRVYKGAATHSHVLRAYALTFEEVMMSSNIEAPVPAITGRNER